MSKFNTTQTKPAVGSGPIVAGATPTGRTYEGAPGYAHDTKSELFLLAVTNMVGEDTFYKPSRGRDSRYAQLVQTMAVADLDWTGRFLGWLRSAANMRSASLVGALEAARALLAAGTPGARQIVDSVLQRASAAVPVPVRLRSRAFTAVGPRPGQGAPGVAGEPAGTARPSLVLVDTSASMSSRPISARSTVTPAKAAAVFGVALAARGQGWIWWASPPVRSAIR